MEDTIVQQQIINAAKLVEEQLDSQLDQLDRMDSSELENLRRKRLEEMKKHSAKKQEWASKGHGEYSEIGAEKEFFDVCKQSENVVCHFYRDSTFRCKIVDKHLHLLAPRHIEARFIKLSVDKAPFLVQRLMVKVLPTIVLVKDTKTKDFIVGFDDLGGHDEFSTEMMEWRIARAGVIEYAGDLVTPPDAFGGSKKKVHVLGQTRKNIRSGNRDHDDDDDSD